MDFKEIAEKNQILKIRVGSHLAPDFSGMIEAHKDDPSACIVNPGEMNLLYVAITRGTEKLYLAPNIKDFIETGRLAKMYFD